MEYYSRIKDGKKEDLMIHLKKTSDICSLYGEKIGLRETGRLLGLVHDLGKHTSKFQQVLFNRRCKINHTFVGSNIIRDFFCDSYESEKIYVEILQFVCISHHENLTHFYDWNFNLNINENFDFNRHFVDGKEISLSSEKEYLEIYEYIKPFLFSINRDLVLKEIKNKYHSSMGSLEKMLFVRMLYSILIDADYTSSASFSDNEYIQKTNNVQLEVDILQNKLDIYMNNIYEKKDANTKLNELRNIIYNNCKKNGKTDEKICKLTAPTGSGKTLSMLQFALINAKYQNKNKIIFVLPYLSIAEQNVSIYKEICGDEIVFEDDSNVKYSETMKEFSEKWNSPIIVTTSVKFFETFFSNNGTNLRKLHNIANSVVCFDESQTLPTDLIDSTINSIQFFAKTFNTTFLFSTATQPNYNYRKNLVFTSKEIVDNIENIYDEFNKIKKVDIVWDLQEPKSESDIYKAIKNENICAVILNTKKQAQKIYNFLSDFILDKDELFLICTNLCSLHRTEILNIIKERIKNNERTILISTQCIEAGVDLDFPTLYSSFSSAESLSQRLGRCNRNANGVGKFVVFNPKIDNNEKLYPTVNYAEVVHKLETVRRMNKNFDINNLSDIDLYYKHVYKTRGLDIDKEKIITAINGSSYSDVAKHYKLIEDKTSVVIVPYNNLYDEILELSEKNNFCFNKKDMKKIMKKYQSITVNTYISDLDKYGLNPLKIRCDDGLSQTNWFLLPPHLKNYYNEKSGFDIKSDDCFVF